jgi:hypothetical protein
MGTTTVDFTGRASSRSILKPVFYALPVVFGAVAVKSAIVALGDPALGLTMLAAVMAGYIGSSAYLIKMMERPRQTWSKAVRPLW